MILENCGEMHSVGVVGDGRDRRRRRRDADDESVLVDVVANDVVVHLDQDALLAALRHGSDLLDGQLELRLDSAF